MLSDGTIVKVTDSNNIPNPLDDKKVSNPLPPVNIVIDKVNDEYKVFFADPVSQAINNGGDLIKDKDELSSGIYSPEAVEKNIDHFARWKEKARNPNSHDERVETMTRFDKALRYIHAGELNERN
jgi:hypothetical protein